MNKKCSRCQLSKLPTDFYANRRQSDGLQVWCKTCVKSYQNARREQHRQEYRDYQKEWFARHPGYYRSYVRKPTRSGAPVVFFEED